LITRIQRNHQDTDAVIALQAHYEAHCDFPSLANLMEGWGDTLRDDRKAAEAYAKAAEAVVAGLGDIARAQALYLQALQRYPEHTASLDRLEALLRERRDDKGIELCFDYVTGELARRDAGATLRATIHFRFGRHYEQRLLQPSRAIAQYRAALELDPTFMPAIEAAIAIYSASGKTAAVADMYELQIAAAPNMAERHALLMALAKYRRERLGDMDGAVLAVRRALKALPSEPSTLELLANLLRERSEENPGESADADRARAAELFYQVARSVRRSHARPRLQACLELQPDHVRAMRMLAELNAYGAQPDAEPELGHASQAEIEALPTGRYPVAQAPQSSEADEEFEAWLDDEDITLIDEGIRPSGMKPITDRPPPPPPPPSSDAETQPRYDLQRSFSDAADTQPRYDTQRSFPV
jgi:tetratricopeptide (TPR) repeat protein